MPDNKKMILNLFAGLQDALFLGDRFAKGEFVSFLQPGQFVSPNLQENADSDDMAIQSDISNTLIDSSYVNKYRNIDYSGGTELLGSVNQVYEDSLTRAALPYREMSPETQAELRALQQWLVENTPNYELYRERYYDAVEAYEVEAHSQTPNPGRLRRLDQRKLDAAKQWNTIGQRALHDRKYGRYTYLSTEDPTTFWARIRQRLQDQARTAPNLGPYYQTFLEPPIAEWQSSGWSTFERTMSEQDDYEYSKNTSWSGGISAGWGLISFGGGASGSSKYRYERSTATTVSLKFDYLRVKILRPWIVEDVFGYTFWTWLKDFGCDQVVSDGGNLAVNPPIRPLGRMPILPRYLIVVRNLELSSTFSRSEGSFYERQLQSSASFGWGPFSLGGSYRESTQSRHVRASFDGVTFRMQHPQIIARTGLILPKCPNPNRKLPWQNDHCFPGENEELARSLETQRRLDFTRYRYEEAELELSQDVARVMADYHDSRRNQLTHVTRILDDSNIESSIQEVHE